MSFAFMSEHYQLVVAPTTTVSFYSFSRDLLMTYHLLGPGHYTGNTQVKELTVGEGSSDPCSL